VVAVNVVKSLRNCKQRKGKSKDLVRDPINFRGMVYAPMNEAGVILLLLDDIHSAALLNFVMPIKNPLIYLSLISPQGQMKTVPPEG